MRHATLVVLFASSIVIAAPASASDVAVAAASSGPDTSLIRMGPEEGGTRAFVAFPAGKRSTHAVIVAHGSWGLNAQIRTIAQQLARQGYLAIVPDLYHGKVAGDAESAHELAGGIEEEQVLDDFDAAIEWLRDQPRTRKARIGAMGFSMGGRLSQVLAMSGGDVSAVVVFYGDPVSDPERIAKLAAPLQGHFGATDRSIPLKRVEEFQAVLEKAGRDAKIYVYPGAGHAFMNDTHESFRNDAARQAWARTLAFFHTHLKK